MLGIKQSLDHPKNESLYHLTGQAKTIREGQLNFTSHCIHMPTDESANRFSIYESSPDQERQGRHMSIKFRFIF